MRRKTAESDDGELPGIALDDEAGPTPTPRFQRVRERRESIEK